MAGTPTHTVSCQGPRGRVSAQPGAFSPCLSHLAGVPVSAPVSWMGLGPALQRAPLLDGALRPRSELFRHNIASLFSVVFVLRAYHELNNDETYLPEMPGVFQLQKHFEGHITQRLQVQTGFYFIFLNLFRASAPAHVQPGAG